MTVLKDRRTSLIMLVRLSCIGCFIPIRKAHDDKITKCITQPALTFDETDSCIDC